MTHAQYRGGSVSGAYVDPYPGRRGDERISRSCSKCSGTGRLHTQVDGGRCWSCGGSGQTSVLVSSARATERRRIRRDAERQAQRETHSEELDQAWERAVEAMRPWLGDRVDVVDKGVTEGEYPSDSVEARLRGEIHWGMLHLRDGKCIVEDVVDTARSMRLGSILGPNFYRMPCVACDRRVARRQGVALEVAVLSEYRFALCAEHAPSGW